MAASPPVRRARWTVGIAYIATAMLLTFVPFSVGKDLSPLGWFGPLLALPAGLIGYWFWRNDFQRDWLDDGQPLPDGVELANDDWRVGLILVAGVAVIVILKATVRLALSY